MEKNSILNDVRQLNKSEFFLLAVFCFVNIINYMDRVGIAAVLVLIEEYFSIGDDLGGLLQTGLLIGYTLSAPFHGYCGDRFNRKIIIISCMALWALSIVCGAFSKKYWALLLSRIVLGIAQSGITTVAPTIISDISVRSARTIFLSCFYLGIPLGAGLGYLTVGAVSTWLNNWIYGLCVGPILCVIGIILMYLVKFPERGVKESMEAGAKPMSSTSYKDDLLYLKSVPSFILVTLGFTFIAFYVGALSWWVPKTLYHGFKLLGNSATVNVESVSFKFGLITVLTGVVGVLIGLAFSTLLRARFPRADPLICGISLLVAIPFITSALSVVAVSKAATFALIFFSELNLNMNWALVTDMLLYTVVPIRRTSAQGLSMLFSHTFGDCISPYLVGVLSEYLKHNYKFGNGSFFLAFLGDEEVKENPKNFHALQMSLFIVAFILLFGSFCFFLTSFFIKTDRQRAQRSIEAGQEVD